MTAPTYRRTPLLIGLIVAACLVGPTLWGLKLQHDLKARALALQGRAAFEAKQYDQAANAYQALVILNPSNVGAWNLLASSRFHQHRLPEALDAVNHAIALKPHAVFALTLRGYIHTNLHQPDAAIADFSEALAIQPDSTEYLTARAVAYGAKGQYQQQLADLRRACALDSTQARALNNQAWLLATCPDASIRDGQQAILLACQACDLSNWKRAGHLDTLAAAYAEVGDFPHAIAWEEKCISLSPQQPLFPAHLSEFQEGRPHHEAQQNPIPPPSDS